MASTIKLKNGSGAPTTGDLVQGEPALDLTNKRLYTENASGVVIEVGTNPSTIDINAGTIDGTVIGGSTAAAGTFTTGQFNTSLNVDGTVTADGLTVNSGATDEVARFEGTGSPYISWYQSGARQAYIGSFGNNFSIVGDTPDTTVSIATGGTNRVTVTATGIDVTGTVTADGLTVADTTGIVATFTSSGATTGISINNTHANGWGSNIAFQTGGTTAGYFGSIGSLLGNTDQDLTAYSTAGNGFRIYTNGNNERLRVTSAGNVGIGTSSPSYNAKLDVNGIIRADVGSGGLSLSGYSAPDMSYVSYNYTNSNGTEVVPQSIRPSHRMSMGNGAQDAITFDYRAANAAAGTWQERVRIDASGNLLVGKTSSGTEFSAKGTQLNQDGGTYFCRDADPAIHVTRLTNDGSVVTFFSATQVGNISVTASSTAYNTSSDERLKENITDANDAGDKIDAIKVRQYDWKVNGSHQDYGMVAQELMTVAPEAVSGDPESDEMMGVDYSKLVPMLIKEVQSLRARVAQLEGAN
jgi:hypothetical protein